MRAAGKRAPWWSRAGTAGPVGRRRMGWRSGLAASLDSLWFFSLHADELATVLGARALLRVPYHWADMSVEAGSSVTYRSRRRCPPTAGHDIVVQPGAPLAAEELVERDHFLTGRWRAFTKIAGRVVTVPVEHQPWPLWSVRVDQLNQDLLTAAGLPAPHGEPLATTHLVSMSVWVCLGGRVVDAKIT